MRRQVGFSKPRRFANPGPPRQAFNPWHEEDLDLFSGSQSGHSMTIVAQTVAHLASVGLAVRT